MITLLCNCTHTLTRPTLLLRQRMYPNRLGDLLFPSLSQFWSRLNTVQLVEAMQCCCTGEKKGRVTGYFPGSQGGESVSISPWPFSGPNGGQLHHYLLPLTSPLRSLRSTAVSLFFVCQPIHLTLFTRIGQNSLPTCTPPTNKELKFP